MAAPHDLKVMTVYLDHDKPISITQCHSHKSWIVEATAGAADACRDEDGCLHPYIVCCVPQYPHMVAKTLVNVAEGKGARKQTYSFSLHVRGLG